MDNSSARAAWLTNFFRPKFASTATTAAVAGGFEMIRTGAFNSIYYNAFQPQEKTTHLFLI
jgi:hypothetical protein